MTVTELAGTQSQTARGLAGQGTRNRRVDDEGSAGGGYGAALHGVQSQPAEETVPSWTGTTLSEEAARERSLAGRRAVLPAEPLEVLLKGKEPLPGDNFWEVVRRVWGALRRYRRLVLLGVLAGLAVAGWLVAHRQLSYRTSASIELRRRIVGRRMKDEEGNQSGVQARSGELYSLRGDDLLGRVAEEMGLLKPLDASSESATGYAQQGSEGLKARRAARAARLHTVNLLRSGLRVSADGYSNIVRIEYTSTDPHFATEVVNRLTDDFIDSVYRKRLTESDKIVNWQLGQLSSLKKEAEQDEQRMLTLQRALGLPGFNTQYNHFEEVLKDMQRQADNATVARIAAEARAQSLAGAPLGQVLTAAHLLTPAGAPVPGASVPNGLRTSLEDAQAQVDETERQVAQLRVTLGARNPRVLVLQAQLAARVGARDHMARGVVEQAANALHAAQLAEDETRATLTAEQKMVNDLAQTNVQFVAAQRAFLESRYLYTQEYLKLRGAGFTAGLKESPVEVIDRAYAPTQGERKAVWRIVLPWLFYGLMAGVVAALALENLRGGVRSLLDAELMLDLPGLISLPAAARPVAGAGAASALTILREPHAPFTLALHLLASTLVLRDADLVESAAAGIGFGPDKLLLFTSATPSEGKTTVACNMAVALAQRGLRVLLIDADLRRPAVHHRLGLSGRIGLSTVLTGNLSLPEALQPMPGVPGLDVLGSGPIPPMASVLLDSAGFAELLSRAAAEYTHVIVDSPPVLAVVDAVQLARLADAVVLVVRHGKVGQAVVRRARDVLAFANAPLLGVVLNAVPEEQPKRVPVPEPLAV